MSVASTDPVETVRAILTDAADARWPSDTPPDRIERYEASEPSEKLREARKTDVSVYIFSPVVGDLTKFAADGALIDQTETVRAEIWTDEKGTLNSYLASAIDIVQDYTNDNQTTTAWTDIWPEENEDLTAANWRRASGFAVNGLQIRLRRNAAP